MVETMKKFTKEAYQDEERIGERNADLVQENAEDGVVNGKCMLCGDMDLVLSEIIFKANYGSRHDGKLTTLCLCGECFDGIIDSVIEE